MNWTLSLFSRTRMTMVISASILGLRHSTKISRQDSEVSTSRVATHTPQLFVDVSFELKLNYFLLLGGFFTLQVVIRDRSLHVFGSLHTALIFSNNDESNYWQFKLYLSYNLGSLFSRVTKIFLKHSLYFLFNFSSPFYTYETHSS